MASSDSDDDVVVISPPRKRVAAGNSAPVAVSSGCVNVAASGKSQKEESSTPLVVRLARERLARRKAPTADVRPATRASETAVNNIVPTGGGDRVAAASASNSMRRPTSSIATITSAPSSRVVACFDGTGFYCNRTAGAPKSSRSLCITDLIPPPPASPRAVLLSSFGFDLEWLLGGVLAPGASPHVLLIDHQPYSADVPPTQISPVALPGLPGWSRVTPRLTTPFGTMHSKVILCGFQDFLRVVIGSPNVTGGDWNVLAQALWVQDFPLLSAGANATAVHVGSAAAGSRETACGVCHHLAPDTASPSSVPFGANFAVDLCAHLRALGVPQKMIESLRRFDFRGAKAEIVCSQPHRRDAGTSSSRCRPRCIACSPSQPRSLPLFGLDRLKSLIEEYATSWSSSSPSRDVFYGVSSIGAITDTFISAFCNSIKGTGPAPSLKVLYPSEAFVKATPEAMLGSGCMFLSRSNYQKPTFARSIMHLYEPSTTSNGYCSHAKVLMPAWRAVGGCATTPWIVLGSHNLSQAAWGRPVKSGSVTCSSFELSVFLLNGPSQPLTPECCPLPFKTPPRQYGSAESPWLVTGKF